MQRQILVFLGLAGVIAAAACGESGPAKSNTGGNLFGGSGNGSNDDPEAEPTKGAPPISGGSLYITRDQEMAFVSDPDRDRVVLVDLVKKRVVEEVALDEGAEPGRATEDAAGHVHVVLRGQTTLLSLDRSGKTLKKRTVCAGPRGVDYDEARDQLVVVCVGGELVRIGAGSGSVVSAKDLGSDLRDVVINQGRTFVSHFRSAEIDVLDTDDNVVRKATLPPNDIMESSVAWKMTPRPEGGVYVSHQLASTEEIFVGASADPGGYGSPSTPVVVETGGSEVDEDGVIVESSSTSGVVLPVDASVSEDGKKVATVGASSDELLIVERGSGDERRYAIEGEPIAVRFLGSDVVVQTREPSQLLVMHGDDIDEIDLGGADVSSVGHAIFHRTTKGPTATLACASCHPEGRDDGHVWEFSDVGRRRTQTLLGGISKTKPFHWNGDMSSLSELMGEVFVSRMGNKPLSGTQQDAFSKWLDTLRDLPSRTDGDVAKAGRAAFEKAGCEACHAGDRFSDGSSANVGTGGDFQVPSLIGVGYRAPYFHDGCARTMEDRFGTCNTPEHGDISVLNEDELGKLTQFLKHL